MGKYANDCPVAKDKKQENLGCSFAHLQIFTLAH